MTRTHVKGYPVIWIDDPAHELGGQWHYEDTMQPICADDLRPCAKCGAASPDVIRHDGRTIAAPDPCLGVLPGVDNACCGHGIRELAYIRFESGVVVKGFDVEYTERWK